jgi:hypothetical protein
VSADFRRVECAEEEEEDSQYPHHHASFLPIQYYIESIEHIISSTTCSIASNHKKSKDFDGVATTSLLEEANGNKNRSLSLHHLKVLMFYEKEDDKSSVMKMEETLSRHFENSHTKQKLRCNNNDNNEYQSIFKVSFTVVPSYLDDWLSFILMSACNHHVISNNLFSSFAGYLHYIQTKSSSSSSSSGGDSITTTPHYDETIVTYPRNRYVRDQVKSAAEWRYPSDWKMISF